MASLLASAVRSHLLLRLAGARKETDELFRILDPSVIYDRPIPERHRIVFYIGHLEAFDWNLFRDHLKLAAFNPQLDHLFAFGIDPVDGGLPMDAKSDWPLLRELEEYRERVRHTLDAALDAEGEDGTLDQLLNIAIEHRLMHAETLEYMFHQLPTEAKIRPRPAPPIQTRRAVPELLPIPAGDAVLGLRRDSQQFGWDNEFEESTVEVPAFFIDKYKVTNGQFARFINSGGYDQRDLWSEADWNWKTKAKIAHPVFWRDTARGWVYRTMFDEVPLPLESPVYVSHAEATAYANWLSMGLPTEAQWLRAAKNAEPPAETRIYWDPPPVGAAPATTSAFGLEDLIGTGWEWTSSQFAPFPGFKTVPAYPGYSANFFDGQHFVMKGGSTRTAACMLRPSFRNWFQPHYQYVYAGFRCVKGQ